MLFDRVEKKDREKSDQRIQRNISLNEP